MNSSEVVVNKSINELVPNKYQPRIHFDEKDLKELSDSIKNYGIINPILVRQVGEKYEIVAGERRYRAAKMCGLKEVPVIIKNVDDKQSAELALIENLHRQDLTSVEAAKSYNEILKLGNYTQNDLANKIGKSQSSIANKLRLLTLPEEVQQAVIEKKISERHARCLLDITNKEKQLEVLKRIIDEKLTVKETEELVELTNTSEEDITRAIQDIMKSLNIKEEKESDNMNNGNFFPTYDNNMNNNNINNQTQNINQPLVNQENVMPTFMTSQNQVTEPATPPINPTLDTNMFTVEQPTQVQNIAPATQEITPMMDTPLFSQPEPSMNASSIPENGFQTVQTPVVPTQEVNETPNYEMNGPQTNSITGGYYTPPTELMNNNPTYIQPEPAPAMVDTPLFSPSQIQEPVPEINNQPTFNQQNTPLPSDNMNEAYYEVPVNISPINETPVVNDRFAEVENLLNSNGINYKAYSNENGHCIIIEI